jgi:dimethylhistidine N-methyltransferase
MSPSNRSALELRDYHPAQRLLAQDILAGLQQTPKRLSPIYLYDEVGSQLFDRICELPEYYLTRTETQLLSTHGESIANSIGADALFVEFGSGASLKTRLLLDRLPRLSGYVPVDISRQHLMAAARSISASYPSLEVLPVCADFRQRFRLPQPARAPSRAVGFFPGSTIGNFDRDDAVDLLGVMRDIVGCGGGLVIGTDLVKDRAQLEAAYNDSQGVTAAFNRNVLTRLNREFGADFDVAAFKHRAIWRAEVARIEMHLVSMRRQTVHIAGDTVAFEAGESLVTEHCQKYTRDTFATLAAAAGWRVLETWTHERHPYSVHYLETAGTPWAQLPR